MTSQQPATVAAPRSLATRSEFSSSLFAKLRIAIVMVVLSLALTLPAMAQTGSRLSFAGVQVNVPASGLLSAYGVAVDKAGDVFIADANGNRVVEVPAGGGAQTTVGTGLGGPLGVAVDAAGDVFIADTGNNRVVEVPAGGGAQTTVPASGLNAPAGVAVDAAGDVFIADTANNRVVEVPAGGGAQTTVGSGLAVPYGVAADGAGDVFIADTNHNRVVEVPAGGGSQIALPASGLSAPRGVAVDAAGNIFIADTGNNRVVEIPAVGNGTYGAQTTVPASGLTVPCGVAVDRTGDVLIANSNVVVEVQRVAVNFGSVNITSSSTLTLNYNLEAATTFGSPVAVLTQGAPDLDFTLGSTTCTGGQAAGTSCTVSVFFAPLAAGVHLGAVVITDSSGNLLATTLLRGVGLGPALAFAGGVQITVPSNGLIGPQGVAVDGTGDVFIADTFNNRVVEIPGGTGAQTTLGNGLSAPSGVAVDGAGDVFIADTGNNRVVEVPYLGNGSYGAQTTVNLGSATLNSPEGIALDGAGDFFIADTGNNRVLEVPVASGGVITLPASGLNGPWGVGVDGAGDVFIADTGNSRVVELPPVGAQTALPATGLSAPTGLVVDGAGDVFVANSGNATVVEVPTRGGAQSTVGSLLSAPFSVALDAAGDVFIADQSNNQVFEEVRSQPPTLSFSTPKGNPSNPQAVTLQNVGTSSLTFTGFAASTNFTVDASTTTCSTASPLAAGATCNVGVDCTPPTAGSFSGTLTLTDNALNVAGTTQTVPLSCAGTGSAASSITVVSNFNGSPYSYPLVFTATVTGTSPTGTVGFTANGAVLSGCSAVTLASGSAACSNSTLPVGTYAIVATYSGDSKNAGSASAALSQQVVPNGVGVVNVTVTNTGNPVPVGALLDVQAEVWTNAGGFFSGTVEFTDGGGAIGGCAAVPVSGNPVSNAYCNYVIGPPAGTHILSGTFTANNVNLQTFGSSNPYPYDQEVCDDNMSLTSSQNPSAFGQPVTFTASVNIACFSGIFGLGYVYFNGNGSVNNCPEVQNTYDTCSVSNLPAGTNTIYAYYIGDYLNGQAESTLVQVVAPSTTLASDANPSGLGQSVTFTATISPETATGTVGFTANGSTITGCSSVAVVAGAAACTTSFATGGTYSAVATYSGDSNFAGSASAALSQVVQAVTFAGVQTTVSAAGLSSPTGTAVDRAGDVFIADTLNNRVVEFPAGGSAQTTVGSGLLQPSGVAVDGSGDIFIADTGNNRIVEVPAGGGAQSTMGSGLSGPAGVAVDISGDVFIADTGNNRVVEVPAGGGTQTTVGSGLSGPSGVAVDASGNVFIADTGNNRVVEIPAGGTAQTTLGGGLNSPTAVAVNAAEDVFIADKGNNRIVEVPGGSGGQITVGATGLSSPQGLAVGGTNDVFIADTGNNRLLDVQRLAVDFRGVNLGSSSTITLSYNISSSVTLASTVAVVTQGAPNLDFTLNSTTCTGAQTGGTPCTVAVTFAPRAPGLREGAVQLKDSSGNLLSTILVHGVGLGPAIAFLPGVQSTLPATGLNSPLGAAVDGAGDIFISDGNNNRVVELPAGGGAQITLPTTGLSEPYGLAVDGVGDLFITDFNNGRVVEVPAGGGTQITVPVSGLINPIDVALDGVGDLFITDYDLSELVEVPVVGTQTTLCGAGVTSCSGLSNAFGVAMDTAGDLFIADFSNERVVEVPANGSAQTTVGSGLNGPTGLAVDGVGNIFIADYYNDRVVEVPADGSAQLTVESGLNGPISVALDSARDLFTVDQASNQVVEMQFSQPPAFTFAPTDVGTASSPQTVTLQNIGNAALTFTSIAASLNFTVDAGTTTCSTSSPLAPGATCNVGVDCAPTATGSLSGTLTLNDNALTNQSIALKCTGVYPTSTALTASPNPSTGGQTVTFIATVSATLGGTPTGSVTFYSGTAGIGTLNLAGGVAKLNYSQLAAGTSSITATYNGSTTDAVSTSPAVSQVVNFDTTTTSLTASPNPSSTGQAVALKATVTPGNGVAAAGTVSFYSGSTQLGNASLSGGVASLNHTFTTSGAYSLLAKYGGSNDKSGSTSSPVVQTVGTTADFAISASPASVATAQGSSGTSTVSTTAVNGFSSAITLTASGQPSGVTVSFSPNPIPAPGTGTSTMTIQVASTTATGTYPITVTGTAGSTIHTAVVSLTVNLPANFTISALPAALSVAQGSSGAATITTAVLYGFNAAITLSAAGQPSGVTVSFSPNPIPAPGSGTSTMTIVVASTSATGSYPITVTGAGSGINQSVTVTLTVTPPPDFSLAASPTSVSVGQGKNGASTITTTALYGFNAAVTLSATGLPTGVTVGFSPNPIAAPGSGNSTMSIAVASSVAVGTYPITVTGTGGGANLSTPVTLNVTLDQTTTTLAAAPNPSTGGQTISFTATVTPAPTSATGLGSVKWTANGAAIGTLGLTSASNGVVTLKDASLLPSGSPFNIVATYVPPNGGELAGSSSSPVVQTVSLDTTATTLTTSPNPSTPGQSVSLTATVTPGNGVAAAGTVSFYSGSTLLGNASLSGGVATLNHAFTTGTYSLTAKYGGSYYKSGSTSSVVTQVARLVSATTVASSLNPSSGGAAVTFTATVTPAGPPAPTGTVAFVSNGTTINGCSAVTLTASQTAACTTTALAVGTDAITAVYSGDTNYQTSTSAALSQTVNKAASTTVLSSSANPSSVGLPVTFTATVTGDAPTGTMAFTSNGITLSGCSAVVLASASAPCSTSTLALGTASIVATYSGDSSNSGSSSPALSQVINNATTTALVAAPNPSTGGQAISFTATVLPPPTSATGLGSVKWTANGAAIGTVGLTSANNGVVTLRDATLLPSGSPYSVVATYIPPTGGELAGSSSSPVVQVVNLDPTTTALTSSDNPCTPGESVGLTATVTPGNGVAAAGTVSFYSGSTLLGNASLSGGVATLNHAFTIGTFSLTAKYAGSNYKSGSTSSVVTQAAKLASATTLLSSGDPSSGGVAVTFTATVTPAGPPTPTGTVAFTANGAIIGGCSAVTLTSSHTAACTTTALAGGENTILAAYTGDSNYQTSTSAALLHIVNKVISAIALASSLNPSTLDQPVTFAATVTGDAPTGTVGFTANGTTLSGCSAVVLVSGTATCSTAALAVGTETMVAAYSGDENNTDSSSPALAQVVNPSPTSTTLTSSLNPSTGGQTVTFTAMVTASGGATPTGTMVFYNGTAAIGTLSLGSGVAKLNYSELAAGTHSITATYGGSATDAPSTSPAVAQVVNYDPTTTVLTTSPNPSTSGHSVTMTATVTPGNGIAAGGEVSFYSGSTLLANVALSSGVATLSHAFTTGTYSLTAKYDGSQYKSASTSAPVSQVVNPD